MIEGRPHLSEHHPHAGFNMIDRNELALIECTETLWTASSRQDHEPNGHGAYTREPAYP